jgi:hypothetical protein
MFNFTNYVGIATHTLSRLMSPNLERLCRRQKMQSLAKYIWLQTIES